MTAIVLLMLLGAELDEPARFTLVQNERATSVHCVIWPMCMVLGFQQECASRPGDQAEIHPGDQLAVEVNAWMDSDVGVHWTLNWDVDEVGDVLLSDLHEPVIPAVGGTISDLKVEISP